MTRMISYPENATERLQDFYAQGTLTTLSVTVGVAVAILIPKLPTLEGLAIVQAAAVVLAAVCTFYFYYYSFAIFRVLPTFVQVLLPFGVGTSVAFLANAVSFEYFGWAATAFLLMATAAMGNTKFHLLPQLKDEKKYALIASQVDYNFWILVLMAVGTALGMTAVTYFSFGSPAANSVLALIYLWDVGLIVAAVVLADRFVKGNGSLSAATRQDAAP